MDWRPVPNAPPPNAPPPPYPGMAQQAPFPGGPQPPPPPPMTMYGGYPPQGVPTYVAAPTHGGPGYATAVPMDPGMHQYHQGYPYGAQYQPGYAYGHSPVIVQQREQPRNTLLESCGIAACCYALLCCCPRLLCFGCDPDF